MITKFAYEKGIVNVYADVPKNIEIDLKKVAEVFGPLLDKFTNKAGERLTFKIDYIRDNNYLVAIFDVDYAISGEEVISDLNYILDQIKEMGAPFVHGRIFGLHETIEITRTSKED